MAAVVKLNGIVLRAADYGENDRILDILSVERGKCVAFAKGVRKPTAKNASAARPLFFGEFAFYEKGDMLWLKEAAAHEDFYSIDAGIEKLSLYTYLTDVVLYSAEENDPDCGILRLLLNTLFYSKTCSDTKFVKTVFELKAAQLLGFEPNLTSCRRCGKKDGLFYHTDSDGAFCKDCEKETEEYSNTLYLDRTSLDACSYIFRSKTERVFAFSVDPATLDRLSDFSSRYLSSKLERRFKSEDYYNMILKNGF